MNRRFFIYCSLATASLLDRFLLQMTGLVLPSMLDRQRGVVINVGSTAGPIAAPYFGVYSATKVSFPQLSDCLFRCCCGDGGGGGGDGDGGGGGGGVCVSVCGCVCMTESVTVCVCE